MTLDYDAVITTGVAKQIAESIRSAIVDGRLKTDERLPTEDELAQRFGVSRPTIREALKRLAAQNLVRSRRGPAGGNFVNRPDPDQMAEAISGAATLMVSLGAFDIDEITTARLEMETICCRLAANNRQQSDIDALATELELQRDASITDQEFCASDVRFHRVIVNATRNRLLQFVMFALVEAILPVTNMVVFRSRDRQTVVAFHSRILEGIRHADADAAIEALGELLAYLRDRYEEARSSRQVRASGAAQRER